MPITHDYTEPFVATPNSLIESSAVNTVHESIRHLKDYLPEAAIGEVGKVLTVVAEDDVDWSTPEVGAVLGEIRMYAGTAEPDLWLFCNGQAVSRSTFSALFALIGTTYGSGNGSTTFNVPDLRDRFPTGAGTTFTLGQSGGAATSSLSGIGVSISSPTGGTYNIESGSSDSVESKTHGHNASLTGSASIRNPYLAVHFMIFADA